MAHIVAQDLFQTTTVIEEGLNGFAQLNLNQSFFEKLLQTYLVDSSTHRVHLYSESQGRWGLSKSVWIFKLPSLSLRCRSGSPGMLEEFADELMKNGQVLDFPVVMTLSLGYQDGQRMVSTASLDLTRHEISLSLFTDDAEYHNLEFLFLQLGIKECTTKKVGEKDRKGELDRVKNVAERCRVMMIEVPRSQFDAKNVDHDLSKISLRSSIELNRSLLDHPLCRSSLSALLKTPVLSAGQGSNLRKYRIKEQKLDQVLKLDKSAQRAFNVFPERSDEPPFHSLYGLINRCKTPGGKRLLKTYLKQPLTDLEQIERRLDVVEVFVSDCLLRDQIQRNLRGLSDLERLLRKLERVETNLPDLHELYRFSIRVPIIIHELQRYHGPFQLLMQSKFIDRLEKLHDKSHLKRFEQLIEAAVDTSRLPEEHLISPQYDPQLQDLSVEKSMVEDKIDALGMKISSRFSLEWGKKLKLDWYKTNNTQIRCLRMNAKEERMVRRQFQLDFTSYETLNDGVKFTNQELTKLATHLQEINQSYLKRQQQLVSQVSEVALTFLEVFEEALSLISELDALCSFGCLSIAAPIPYTRPRLSLPDHGMLSIKGGRHPLLEAQDGVDFVKNDCCLVQGESWFQIITGPNMGGKSTFIRQVGLIVLMAQIGCFVPCDEAMIPIRDCLFTRVGAGDSQQRGISTFMSEMLDSAAMLHGASSRSLVIVDELGRGTSTCDGFGIAYAISKYIMNTIKAPTLFATHFYELTKIEGAVGVKNLHVVYKADPCSGRVAMLHQVRDGVCDKSFGVQVADFVQFPKSVVYLAQRILRHVEGIKETEESTEDDLNVKQLLKGIHNVLDSEQTPREQCQELQRLLAPLEKLRRNHRLTL